MLNNKILNQQVFFQIKILRSNNFRSKIEQIFQGTLEQIFQGIHDRGGAKPSNVRLDVLN